MDRPFLQHGYGQRERERQRDREREREKEKREKEREKGKNRQGVTGDQACSIVLVGSEKEIEA